MGNIFTKDNDTNEGKIDSLGRDSNRSFDQIMDFIATHYILTTNFKSLKRLSEKEYCDQLVLLTSNIIDHHFNHLEVSYLENRIKDGKFVSEMKKQPFIFSNQSQLSEMDQKNELKKKKVCIGIAKFYIKIAHVFAAILTTINPVYMYKDETGNPTMVGLKDKDHIPQNVSREIAKLNICDERVDVLKSVQDSLNGEKKASSSLPRIPPKMCNMNINPSTGKVKTLEEEPGIPEFMQLYFDDVYDYSTGEFNGMSSETQRQYQADLQRFYKIFTGNKEMPPEIKKFSDIKLRNYQKIRGCQNKDISRIKRLYDGSFVLKEEEEEGEPKWGSEESHMNSKTTSELMKLYAAHLKRMISMADQKQNELLAVINELFTFSIDEETKEKNVTIHPKLTDDSLQRIVEKTRRIIMELYLQCEEDYHKGMKIYEAVVESKILETTRKQLETLDREATHLLVLEDEEDTENDK